MEEVMSATMHIGPFRVCRPLGRGGMGMVVEAIHATQGRRVAMKVVTAEKAKEERFIRGFQREVRAVARLRHPNIVEVYDSGEIGPAIDEGSEGWLVAGSPYLVMELADFTLSGLLRHSLEWPQIGAILMQTLKGLAHSHARGVIHRDLKPDNILFVQRGDQARLILSDFGLARAWDGLEATDERSKFIIGTPRYMAPEQIRGEARRQGPWTDLYAVGCLAYRLVCGKAPFDGDDVEAILRQHLGSARPELQPRVEVPAGFDAWISRALMRDPERRWRRAADAIGELAAIGPTLGDAPPTLVHGDAEGGEHTVTLVETGRTTRMLIEDIQERPTRKMQALTDDSAARATRAAMPDNWRQTDQSAAAQHIEGTGLGVYGLRQIPLVGRERERDQLWSAMSEAIATGRPQAVILKGPAGIGKTRLAEWLAERGHEVGAASRLRATHSQVSGSADGLSRMFADFLRVTGLALPRILELVQGWMAGAVVADSTVLNDSVRLATLLAWGADPSVHQNDLLAAISDADEQHRLWNLLLHRLVERRPLVIHLDDVHWGHPSLQWVLALMTASHAEALPVTIVMTLRDDLLDDAPLAARVLTELRQAPAVTTVDVAPLSTSEHRDLIENLLGLQTQVAHQVASRTSGNPLFAIQLVGDWVERGVLEWGDQGFRLVEGEQAPLPDTIQQLLLHRVSIVLGQSLDDAPGRELLALELAATLGRRVHHKEWRWAMAVAGIDYPSRLVEVLAGRNMLVVDETGWSFASGVLREAVLHIADLGGRQQDHHRCCVEALEAVHGSTSEALASRIAHHLLAAGQHERALTVLVRAIHYHHRICQFEAGELLFQKHEASRAHLGIGDDDRRTQQAWKELVALKIRADRCREVQELADRVESTCRQHHWSDLLAEALANQTRIARRLGELDAALGYAEEALAISQDLADNSGVAWSNYNLATLYRWKGDLRHAARIAGVAVEQFQGLQDLQDLQVRQGLAYSQGILGTILTDLGEFEDAQLHFRTALELFEKLGDVAGYIDMLNNLGELQRKMGDLEAARACYRETLEICKRSALRKQSLARINLAWIHLALQEFDEAERELTTILPADGGGLVALDRILDIGLYCLRAGQGRWHELDALNHRITVGMEEAPLIDVDLADAFQWTTRWCLEGGHPEQARAAAALARQQWEALDRQDRLRELAELYDWAR